MKNKIVVYVLFIIFGVVIGVIGYAIIGNVNFGEKGTSNRNEDMTLYSCGMHPDIVQEQPGTCPICGKKIVLDILDQEYCPHIEFIYGSAEENFFVYVKPSFVEKYYNALKDSNEFKEYLAENEYEEISKEDIKTFTSGYFEPMDEVSKFFPYFYNIAIKSGPNIIFSVEWSSYSTAYVGIRTV